MSGLRTLALCFLVSASAFCLAAVLQTRPDLKRDLAGLAGQADQKLWRPARDYLRKFDLALLDAPQFPSDARAVVKLDPPTPNEERLAARVDLPSIERPGLTERPTDFMDAPIAIAPDLPDIPLPPDPPPVAARTQALNRPPPGNCRRPHRGRTSRKAPFSASPH